LRRAHHSSKESYRLCKNYYGTEEEAKAEQRAVVPLMMMMMVQLLTASLNKQQQNSQQLKSITPGFEYKLHGTLKIFQRFGNNFCCHLQGENLWEGFRSLLYVWQWVLCGGWIRDCVKLRRAVPYPKRGDHVVEEKW
jgi:hypothetical protein